MIALAAGRRLLVLRRFHMMESSAKETFAFLYSCWVHLAIAIMLSLYFVFFQRVAADSEEQLHNIGTCWMHFHHGQSRSTGRDYTIMYNNPIIHMIYLAMISNTVYYFTCIIHISILCSTFDTISYSKILIIIYSSSSYFIDDAALHISRPQESEKGQLSEARCESISYQIISDRYHRCLLMYSLIHSCH